MGPVKDLQSVLLPISSSSLQVPSASAPLLFCLLLLDPCHLLLPFWTLVSLLSAYKHFRLFFKFCSSSQLPICFTPILAASHSCLSLLLPSLQLLLAVLCLSSLLFSLWSFPELPLSFASTCSLTFASTRELILLPLLFFLLRHFICLLSAYLFFLCFLSSAPLSGSRSASCQLS